MGQVRDTDTEDRKCTTVRMVRIAAPGSGGMQQWSGKTADARLPALKKVR